MGMCSSTWYRIVVRLIELMSPLSRLFFCFCFYRYVRSRPFRVEFSASGQVHGCRNTYANITLRGFVHAAVTGDPRVLLSNTSLCACDVGYTGM